jgi:hypothetical protein
VSVQDRCVVYARCTMGSKIVLDTPHSTTRCGGSSGSSFQSFQTVLILMQDRCTVCVESTISSEIILDAPDGTPR